MFDDSIARWVLVTAVAGAVAGILLLVWLTLALRRWWKARLLAARMDIAADGEQRAEAWLVARGYRVFERQAGRRATMHINGRVAEFDVRADFLVQMGEEMAVVEVKTGDAADPRLPATRRQLREYIALFEVDRIYVFDATAERLHEVRFPEA
jgi:Holliday junction resolvase-like predicted endonuclease